MDNEEYMNLQLEEADRAEQALKATVKEQQSTIEQLTAEVERLNRNIKMCADTLTCGYYESDMLYDLQAVNFVHGHLASGLKMIEDPKSDSDELLKKDMDSKHRAIWNEAIEVIEFYADEDSYGYPGYHDAKCCDYGEKARNFLKIVRGKK